MTTEEGFSPEELALLGKAALQAGGAVALAKYSGARGTAKEFEAIVDGLQSLRRQRPDSPLFQGLPMDAIQQDAAQMARGFDDDPKQSAYQDYKMVALNRVSDAVELLYAKATPEEGAAFRQAVLWICQMVAERSKEGGFMGIGGVPVDPKEIAVIEEIRRVLQL